MEPKEKAKQLIYKHWTIPNNSNGYTISFKQAIYCAECTCDEIIKASWGNENLCLYWDSVKLSLKEFIPNN